jgi:hypothetical protein
MVGKIKVKFVHSKTSRNFQPLYAENRMYGGLAVAILLPQPDQGKLFNKNRLKGRMEYAFFCRLLIFSNPGLRSM